jgi:hypothetical protein
MVEETKGREMPNAQSARPLGAWLERGHLFARPLQRCPACGSELLEPVVDVEGEDVHFSCQACGRCWRVELGYVHPVNPPTSRARLHQ